MYPYLRRLGPFLRKAPSRKSKTMISLVRPWPAVLALILATAAEAGPLGRWTPTSTTGAPAARELHTGLWTGSKMLIWGGWQEGGLRYLGTGATYDPATNAWAALSTTGAPQGRLFHGWAWTGSRLLVWGGKVEGGFPTNTGGVYDPASDSWAPMSTTGAPEARRDPVVAWTGSKMLVWGGWTGDDAGLTTTYFGDGAVYDPASDTWAPMSATGAPSPRTFHTGTWTGSKLFVWGGHDGSSYFGDGAAYDPATDTWSPVATDGAPSSRRTHTATWTGSKVIVWGGYDGTSTLATGGVYDPAANAWTAVGTSGAPEGRFYHQAAWTGTKMIVWGGYGTGDALDSGGVYTPATGRWAAFSSVNAPSRRLVHSAVWTGRKMIVWGGQRNLVPTDTGGIWGPGVVSGDFDGDDKVDLLWRNQATGDLYVWLMDGTVVRAGTYLTPQAVGGEWAVRGIHDFDGDGKVDILWRSTTGGRTYLWFMDGTTATSGAFPGPASVLPAYWQVRGVDDFDGDGRNDILWHDQANGELYAWLMNGAAVTAGAYLSPRFADPAWQVRGVADFDGNGSPDLLWQNEATRALYVWFMDGTAATGGSLLSPQTLGAPWRVARIADFDGDLSPDILWRNDASGELFVWRMDAVTAVGGTFLTPKSSPDGWRIEP